MRQASVVQIVQVLANLGVLAGIIFLAVEVNQNRAALDEANRLNRISALGLNYEAASQLRIAVAQDADLARIVLDGYIGNSLEPVEQLRFQSWCQDIFWQEIAGYDRMNTLGEKDVAAGIVTQTKDLLSSPGMRSCWDSMGPQVRLNGFETFLESVNRN